MTRADARLVVLLTAALLVPCPSPAQVAAPVTAPPSREAIRDFLLTARVVRSRTISKGITAPKRLTLTDGVMTHDAAFQSVDARQTLATLGGGGRQQTVELNFVDAYRYNLAAYGIAELVGLGDMMPVHVERRWSGQTGSLSWWVDTLMDEGERLKKKLQPPNITGWNQQMYRMRAFAALTRDTDRNLGNVLITPDWQVVMIDFTRAFRLQLELIYANDLGKIDRTLLPRLEGLSHDAIKKAVGRHLTDPEIDAMLKRRDAIVGHFRKRIAELGAAAVLY
jgi:hypothetical protein